MTSLTKDQPDQPDQIDSADTPALEPAAGPEEEGGSAAVRHAAAAEQVVQEQGRELREALAALGKEDAELAAVLATGVPFIRCGCDFLAVSPDQYQNRLAVDRHSCTESEEDGSAPWYAYLLSWEAGTVLIPIAFIVYALVTALTGNTDS